MNCDMKGAWVEEGYANCERLENPPVPNTQEPTRQLLWPGSDS